MQYPLGEMALAFFEDLRQTVLTVRPGADIELIERACDVAALCHEGQKRRSGDPYITHPIAVARILAGLEHADDQTVCAAILHDTVEDTAYTMAALRRDFGAAIATMVDGHTALDRLRIRRGRSIDQVMAAITSTDNRIVAMKMADRLHNMQTLQCLPQATQLQKAREVLDIFLPVAQQLSIALDIESSTTRPDPVKAELRTMLYEFFDAALRSAGLQPRARPAPARGLRRDLRESRTPRSRPTRPNGLPSPHQRTCRRCPASRLDPHVTPVR